MKTRHAGGVKSRDLSLTYWDRVAGGHIIALDFLMKDSHFVTRMYCELFWVLEIA